MVGFVFNEEIQLYEVLQYLVFFKFVIICCFLEYFDCGVGLNSFNIRYLFKSNNVFFVSFLGKFVFDGIYFWVQEIKFEFNVMCEYIDKKFMFKVSQVSLLLLLLRLMMRIDIR